jgi:hypothetical protein
MIICNYHSLYRACIIMLYLIPTVLDRYLGLSFIDVKLFSSLESDLIRKRSLQWSYVLIHYIKSHHNSDIFNRFKKDIMPRRGFVHFLRSSSHSFLIEICLVSSNPLLYWWDGVCIALKHSLH